MIQINTKIDMDLPATCQCCRFNKNPNGNVAICLLGTSGIGDGFFVTGEFGRLPGCLLTLVVNPQFEPPSNARWFYMNPGESKEAAMLGWGQSWVPPHVGGVIGFATKQEAIEFAEDEALPSAEVFWATEEDFNKIFRRRT
jgi:hypothetical protein